MYCLKRPDLTPGFLLLTAFLFLLNATYAEAQNKEAKKPNIIVILSDDIGYSDIGTMGSEIKTPSLDRLAAGGMMFTNFYNTSRCSPSRATLLTGLYAHQASMGHLATRPLYDEPGYIDDLNRNAATIAEILKKSGYATYMTGKWHLTALDNSRTPEKIGENKTNWPLQRGFDRFFGNLSGSASYYDPFTLLSNNDFVPPGKDFYYTDAISDSTVKFIMEHPAEKPFFFYVAFYAAHWPLQAPEEAIEKYRGVYDIGWDSLRILRYNRMMERGIITGNHRLTVRPPEIVEWDKEPMKEWQARRMETFAAMIDIMDQGIGRIIAALEEKGELDNTVIFYMQDNGGCAEPVLTNSPVKPLTEEQKVLKPFPYDQIQTVRKPEYTRDGRFVRSGRGVMAGDADTWVAYGEDWANVSNTPFRLYKSFVHEGGIITPMIVHWPAGIKTKGTLNREAGHLIDIMPTCLEIAGATYPDEFNGNKTLKPEGLSLVPVFKNRKLNRKYLFWEHEGNRAIRMGKWKLVSRVKTPMEFTSDDENSWELFNLDKDPSETTNLAGRRPHKVKKMALKWEKEAVRIQAKPWPWTKK